MTKERPKGWYIKQSFSNDFVDWMEELYRTYGENIFEIQGIANRYMDIVQFSKTFFSKSGNVAVADITVDSNANVREKNVIQYNYENNKALMRLNSLYLMYKYVKKFFSKEDARKSLERVVNGELFVNDLSGYSLPYSYYQETPIIVKINDKIHYLTLKHLYDLFKENEIHLPDRSIINTDELKQEVTIDNFVENKKGNLKRIKKEDYYTGKIYENIEIKVLDKNKKWVKITQITKHKNTKDFIIYQTNNGDFAFVTEDHSIILTNGKEIKAGELKEGDEIIQEELPSFKEYIDIPENVAYLIGFLIGDENIKRHLFYQNSKNVTNNDLAIVKSLNNNVITIYQKNITNTKIYKVIRDLFPELKINVKDNQRLSFSSIRLHTLLDKYFNIDYGNSAFTVSLPSNILSWKKESKLNLIAGLIDAEGTITENGLIDIRMSSYSIINQLYDVLRTLNIQANKRICGEDFEKFLFGVSFRTNNDVLLKQSVKCSLHNKSFFDKKEQFDTIKRNNHVKKVIRVSKEFKKLTQAGENILEYVYDITTESGTFYANGMLQHNCYAFDLRNLLTKGMDFYKGNMKIKPPKRSDSFISLLIQSTAYISNQIMGASSYPDFFVILDWFYRKEMGHDYIKILRNKQSKEWYWVKNQFQTLIYSFNFPFRGNQSAFTNLSVMDRGFLNSLFDGYVLPDFSYPDYESTLELSKLFFEYYTEINSVEGIFTFPVMTLAISLDDNGNYIDPEFVDWVAEANAPKALANIFQDKPTSFSSCCRLKNDYSKVADAGYQNSFGVAGLSIGSHRVAGLNLPRIAFLEAEGEINRLEEDLEILHKILYSHRQLIKERIEGGYLPLYTYGWIDLSKQYSTIGFVGGYEYVKNKGLSILEEEGQKELARVLKIIESKIVKWQEDEKEEKNIYNIEQIPAESMAVRLAKIDYYLGYNNDDEGNIKYELYSNQYIPLIENASIYDRFKIQGKFDSLTSGGAILHLNIDDEKPINSKLFRKLIDFARKMKTVYFAINYAYSECEDGHFSIGKHDICPICEKAIVQQYTRVVGFITPVKSWNKTRREYEYQRRVFYKNGRLEDYDKEKE